MSNRDNDGWEIVSAKKSHNAKSSESPSLTSNDDDTPTWLANYIQIRTGTPNNINNLHQISSLQQSSILLLVGLPGSGKSTFANALEKLEPWKYVVVNQDQLKTRQKVLDKTKKILINEDNNKKCVVIDRCNFDSTQRRHFFELIESISTIDEKIQKDDNKNDINRSSDVCVRQDIPSSSTVIPIDCIVFDIDAKICEQRCLTRRNHPTLKKQDVLKVIRMMQKAWIPPNVNKKENFRHITTITNDHEFQSKLISMLESES